jgi:hypothetical protein
MGFRSSAEFNASLSQPLIVGCSRTQEIRSSISLVLASDRGIRFPQMIKQWLAV